MTEKKNFWLVTSKEYYQGLINKSEDINRWALGFCNN